MSQNNQREALLKKWNKLESAIVAESDHAYNLEWGARREKFYNDNAYIPCSDADIERLGTLKGQFKGERIFVLGNGPSLNQTPLELLKDEFTFVTNRIYLLFDRIDWRPTFYTATDWRVIPDIAHEINLLTGMTFFFEERFRGILRSDDEDIYWHTHNGASDPNEKLFAYDITKGVRGAGSVTGTAIQIAFYLGFSPIYLIGCDLGYKVGGTVIQEGPDKFGTGTRLYLTSTIDDDASHFDKRYFGKGRRWHDPHVDRMIEGHKQCKAGITKAGGEIYNATIGGELEVYERVDFKSLFLRPKHMAGRKLLENIRKPIKIINPVPEPWKDSCLLGPFARCEHADINENYIIFELIKNKSKGVMVDVGAHQGSALLPFAQKGWCVYAFEPDPINRGSLEKKISALSNVTVDTRGVSDKTLNAIPFYSSPESTGVSCLKPFLDSHKESTIIDTVSLADWCQEMGVSSIDFLKIDTEGFDLMVLKGLPWDRVKPEMIVCEYEDKKTVPLGYTMHDMASYLIEKGYDVLVSEWHPIIRYGIKHDWSRLIPYSKFLDNEKTWGNLIAFRDLPSYSRISTIAKQTVNLDLIKTGHKFSKFHKPVSLPEEGTFRHTGIVFNGAVVQEQNAYKIAVPQGKNWIVDRFLGHIAPGNSVSARVSFALNTDCTLTVMLCRDGNTPFEKASQKISLPKGTHTLTFRHTFKHDHQGARIQFGVVDKPVTISGITSEMKFESHTAITPSPVKTPPQPIPAVLPAPAGILPTVAIAAKPKVADNTLIIMGNGPSLRGMDFRRFNGYPTLGMNVAFRHWHKINWYPTYYICLDTVVTESQKDGICKLVQEQDKNGIRMFLLRRNLLKFYAKLKDNPSVLFFEDYRHAPVFEDAEPVSTGSHAALFGAMLGYRRICLLGIDCRYVQQIPEARKVEGFVLEMTSTPGQNPNYFIDDYQQKGDRFNIPDSLPDLHYQSWVMAGARLEKLGVDVVNCNPASRLDMFDVVPLDEWLGSR